MDEGYPLPISIDTKKAKVAQEALEAGVEILNDVSGFQNPAIREVAWKYQPGVCIMHMKGIPENMQRNPYYDDVFQEISQFLLHQARLLEEKNDKGRGLAKEKIVLDPGIGFGKRLEDNLDIFLRIPDFVQLGYPVLIGASRKSFIQMICGEKTPRLGGSVAIHFYSFMKGASIVRVHDVKETREALLLWEALYKREKEIQGLSVF
ncbi:MAG: dihydropteroate synthase [Planctomycetota bacterium]|nr:MAG: dihydropteroate synthase [Planctomycetota bacterium]